VPCQAFFEKFFVRGGNRSEGIMQWSPPEREEIALLSQGIQNFLESSRKGGKKIPRFRRGTPYHINDSTLTMTARREINVKRNLPTVT